MTMATLRIGSSTAAGAGRDLPRPAWRRMRPLAGTVASCLGLALSAGVTLGLVFGAF